MKKTLAITAILIGMASLHTMGQTQERTVRLRFIETSDVHGHFFPYNFITGKAMKGTLARASSYINKVRAQYGDNLLLLDNGDILQGQPISYWSNYVANDRPNIAAQVLNYMRYDAAAMGNHDVETGHQVYDRWIKETNCPVLGANIVNTSNGLPYIRPYQLFYRDGVKIAVLGMLTPAIPYWLNENLWQGLRFQEMVHSATQWMYRLKVVEQADIVIGLFHSGDLGGITTPEYEEDAAYRVAQQVPGFDIIFFGHDHRMHQDWVQCNDGRQVLCLDPSCFAQQVADATIELVYRDGHLADRRVMGQVVSIADEPIDEQMVAHFQPVIDEVKRYVERPIGQIQDTITTRDCFFGPSAFTDLIHNLQLQLTGADISFNAPLTFDATIQAGTITQGDMFKLYRYENQICVLRMTGEEIRRHLEMSYDQWVNTMQSPFDHIMLLDQTTQGDQQRTGFKNMTFNFDSAAGIDYEVDVTKPDGQKVRILRMSNGKKFDESRTYNVVMNSYRANGGGELLTLGAGIDQEELAGRIVSMSEMDQRHYLTQEIERMGTIDPKPNNNWRFVPANWAQPALERDRKLIFRE